MAQSKPHIVVFFGGTSDSHDLSQETGYWVCNYIPRSKYRVTPVRVTPEGTWQVPLGGLPQQGSVDRMLEMLFASVRPVPAALGMQRLLHHPVAAMMTTVRGPGGDDGSLHTLGSTLGIPVVGSNSATCQQTSHKQLCAIALDDIVATPYSLYFRRSKPDEEIAQEVRDVLMPPFFVKPTAEEGSAGVYEVQSLEELAPAIRIAKTKGDILVQERAPGTEITVTVVEDERGKSLILPPTLVVPKAATFYDELAKRRQGRVVLHTPDPASNRILWEAQALAQDVYDQLGCRGYASVDMVTHDHGIQLLEVNTIPTLTSLTPLRQQLQAAHLHPTTFIDSLISRSINQG
ncbi:MAG: ATP-grasp domain-containing protein [Candidatus Andersenbacteria bacterium]